MHISKKSVVKFGFGLLATLPIIVTYVVLDQVVPPASPQLSQAQSALVSGFEYGRENKSNDIWTSDDELVPAAMMDCEHITSNISTTTREDSTTTTPAATTTERPPIGEL